MTTQRLHQSWPITRQIIFEGSARPVECWKYFQFRCVRLKNKFLV